jgi:hypothetical protein
VLVLRRAIAVGVYAGNPRPDDPRQAVYLKLRHAKLPQGAVMFAMLPGAARELAQQIIDVADQVDGANS